MVEVTFADIVKKIGKTPEEAVFTVIFDRHAAFYWVKETNTSALEALSQSASDRLQVIVVCDGVSSEIVEARLAE